MDTVLIVDDEKNYPLILSAVLSEEGFEPLDQFGTPNAGCTEIRYLEKGGKWVTL